MRDQTNNPRHRIDAAKALRQASIDPASEAKAQTQTFSINLHFGTNKVRKEIELKPVAPLPEAAGEHDDYTPEWYGDDV
jgi:hypothetical protein